MRHRLAEGEVIFEPIVEALPQRGPILTGTTGWILNNQDLGFGAEFYRRFKRRHKEEVWELTTRINNVLRDEAIGRALGIKAYRDDWHKLRQSGASDSLIRAEIQKIFRLSGISGGSGGPGIWTEAHRWKGPSIELHQDDSAESWRGREILKGKELIRETRRILGIPEKGGG